MPYGERRRQLMVLHEEKWGQWGGGGYVVCKA